MNRKGEQFDWNNDDLSELKTVDNQPKLVHKDIISEISSVETEDMYPRIIGPIPIGNKGNPPVYAERTAKAHIKYRPRCYQSGRRSEQKST